MVKKKLELLNGPPEFEKVTATVRFPTNINGEVKNRALDKIRLVSDAQINEDMSEQEMLSNVENVGEIMEEVQNYLIEYALKHMKVQDKEIDVCKQNLTPSAYDTILQQYADQVKGVKVSGN